MFDVISPSVTFLQRQAVLVVLLLFLSVVQSALAAPDLILYNAHILVVDEGFSEVEALAIEDGRICAIGRNFAVRALADEHTQLENLQGRTVIPGLIDNHIHAIRAAQRWRHEVRLDGVTDYNEALAMIADKADTLAPGEWVIASGGFVERQFLDQPDGFRLADLDKMAPDNPVYLQHLFDWGYVNSRALASIGIDSSVMGQSRRGLLLDEHQLPSGTVTLATQQAIRAQLPVLAPDAQRDSTQMLLKDLNRQGLTTVLDAGGFDTLPRFYTPFRELAAQQQLTVRVFYLQQLIPWGRKGALLPDMSRLEHFSTDEDERNWFKPVGVGEQLYLPLQDSAGRAAQSSFEVRQRFSQYAQVLMDKGVQLHLHAVNDQSINQHLNQLAPLVERYNVRALRWTFAHADGIKESTAQRVAEMGLNIAAQARPWLIGYRFQRRFGGPAAQMTPLRMLTEQGLRWGLGSDGPVVASVNPFHSLDWAVNGTMVDGQPLSQQVVSREQALIAHTRNNARLIFAENYLGSLEPGKRADLVVLDRNYLTAPAQDIRHIRPLGTMVDGRWVYRVKGPE